MQIRAEEIEYKKNIGTLDGHPVMELGLKGGYHIVCAVNGPRIDYLGVGPHRAVARFMAKKRKPDLQIMELSKSEQVDSAHFQHFLPQYEAVCDRLNVLSRDLP
jgi:hypothetical protein